jgi:hypothetical protein
MVFLTSCTHEEPQIKNIIDAIAEVDALSPIYEFRIDVRLKRSVQNQQEEPIAGALVIVNSDTLAEVEPGHYLTGYAEVYVVPETLNFQIISDEDTILYSLPMPSNVFIISPQSFDRISSGEDLNIIWRRNPNANFYEVQLFLYSASSPDTNEVIFDTLIVDTSVTVPGDVIEPGTILILVKAVSGLELINGEIRPNYYNDNWEGTFVGKVGSYVIVTSIATELKLIEFSFILFSHD